MPKSKAGPPNIREAPRVYVKDNAIGLLMHSVLARERLVILDSPFTVSGQESCKVSFTYNGHVFAGKQIFNPGGGPLSPPNAGLPMGLHYPLTPSGAGCDGPCATAAQPGALDDDFFDQGKPRPPVPFSISSFNPLEEFAVDQLAALLNFTGEAASNHTPRPTKGRQGRHARQRERRTGPRMRDSCAKRYRSAWLISHPRRSIPRAPHLTHRPHPPGQPCGAATRPRAPRTTVCASVVPGRMASKVTRAKGPRQQGVQRGEHT